ncbi:DUF726 domain-containing protein [Demequina lignilytica]|uniref:DUF726 domain-containing protein n=1 Tax=Demequina lignilytica TaxID=3051663 RepID=A0AB35MHF3_9MICO|nr:DUF726 domain-containing protein [Demequina sp. SYSU T0a273]MDN4483203.1 DUF726 domain-containing protein [Demequina sp. SYSU T0a273]
MATAEYTPKGHIGYAVEFETQRGSHLLVTDTPPDGPAELAGDEALAANVALVDSLVAYGRHEFQSRRLRATDAKTAYQKQAAVYRGRARFIGELVDGLGDKRIPKGWCSACFTLSSFRRSSGSASVVPTYLCGHCGAPVTPCAVAGCKHLANRGTKPQSLPRYCAEHRHDIPGFAKALGSIPSLDDYEEWLRFEKINAARATKVIGYSMAATVVVAPMAFFAAPAIGGALGAMTGLSGAAATSHGLALLGGGALAAGGAGMAGGTVVVTVVGGMLGGAAGAVTTSAYVSSDKSFKIVKLKDGVGTPVLVANGFLTEKDFGWGGWRSMVEKRYPEAPVYRVHWGAKALKDLTDLATLGAGKQAAVRVAQQLAKKASKLAKIPGLSAVMVAGDIAGNPWTVAKTRATMTGTALAGILARVDGGRFVLVGHSLGAKVMATAAEVLATAPGAPRVEAVHLIGAAVTDGKDWSGLNGVVIDGVWNYYSSNDRVLNTVYRTVEGGKKAIGTFGISRKYSAIHNVSVSARVPTHSAYFDKVTLKGSRPKAQPDP